MGISIDEEIKELIESKDRRIREVTEYMDRKINHLLELKQMIDETDYLAYDDGTVYICSHIPDDILVGLND